MEWNFQDKLQSAPVYVYHIIGWLVYFFEDIIELIIEPWTTKSLALTFSGQLIALIVFYGFFWFIWPRTFQPGKYFWAIPGLLLGMLGFTFLRYFIQEMVFPAFLGFSNYRDNLSFWYYFGDNFRRPLRLIFLSGVIYLLIDQWQKEKRNRQLESAKIDAELALLRSQVNPHFLFNMLNYVYTEAFMVDKKLANSVLQLSGLLRYGTQNSLKNKTTLQREVAHLQDYIDLMRKRFGDRCHLDFIVQGQVGEQPVEPLLFLPFVENAFKHGIYTQPEYPIQVTLEVNAKQLHFRCKNLINQHQKDEGSGIGIQNVQKRLQLLYPDQYQLKIEEENNVFNVDLFLSLS